RMQILDEPEPFLGREKAPAVPSRVSRRHQITIWPSHRRNAARTPEVDVHAGTVEGAERVIDRLEIGLGQRKSVERQETLPNQRRIRPVLIGRSRSAVQSAENLV